MPGFANTLLVSYANTQAGGVCVLDNGVPRALTVPLSSTSPMSWVQFTPDGTQAYGLMGLNLYCLGVNGSGPSVSSISPNQGYESSPILANGMLYFPYGEIVNPTGWSLLQGQPTPDSSNSGGSCSVCPDVEDQVVYYSNVSSILSFAMANNEPLGAFALEYSASPLLYFGRLLRYGTSSLLFQCQDFFPWGTPDWTLSQRQEVFLLQTTDLK